ncbi:MAG: DNA recombination protein RmuC [Candidatus Micrarchaeia archaeon]
MVAVTNLLWGFVGLLFGLLLSWLYYRGRLKSAEELVGKLEHEKAQLQEKNSQLEKEVGRLQEQAKWIESAELKLREIFQTLATEVLRSNAEEFIQRARDQLREFVARMQGSLDTHREQLSKFFDPLEERLRELDNQVRALEEKRSEAYGDLKRWLEETAKNQQKLYEVATNLSEAFRKSPTTRGAWGELQLRNIVELAGMLEHVDFVEQKGMDKGRPDMIVKLPNNGFIAVDAKTPLERFFEAIEAKTEEERMQKLKEHADAVRTVIQQLGKKEYWQQLSKEFGGSESRSPEFVVMFVPHEAALAEAFRQNPNLLEEALKNRVIPTSPTVFFALLKTIAYGWMQHKAIANAEEIVKEAKELCGRLHTCFSHVNDLAKNLGKTVESYNEFVDSLERRVMPSARRLGEKSAVGEDKDLAQLKKIDASPRLLAWLEASESKQREGGLFKEEGGH